MYEQDSFFMLSQGGRIGLVCVTLALTFLVLVVGWWAMQGQPVAVRLLIAVLLFAAFVWLSPQVYYAYYRVIFNGLPQQWVVGWPPIGETLRKAIFIGPANLSAHGQGVLFWLLIAMAFMGSGRRGQRP